MYKKIVPVRPRIILCYNQYKKFRLAGLNVAIAVRLLVCVECRRIIS